MLFFMTALHLPEESNWILTTEIELLNRNVSKEQHHTPLTFGVVYKLEFTRLSFER